MKLKSFIEKTILVNETVNTSNSAKNSINKNYLHGNDFYSSNELEEIFSKWIQYTEDTDLKIGLKIILKLISHKNENIRISALSKLYFLIENEYIQQIILKELKNMPKNENRKSAEYALESIALEVHKFELFDITSDLLVNVENKINLKLRFKFLLNISNDLYNVILANIQSLSNLKEIKNLLKIFNPQISIMIPYLKDIDYMDNENLIKDEIIIDKSKMKINKGESIESLAKLYSLTFTEKGHLRRLITLLDDKEYEIQQIGVNSLINIVEAILRNSN
ncbi:MAG: hypothetical protein ACPK7O_02320 [Methanobacterium sp.]